MERVELVTKSGEHVAVAKIASFDEAPDVLVWGTRAFQAETVKKEGELWKYRECFACAVVNVEGDES